jgi:hypothetical protein
LVKYRSLLRFLLTFFREVYLLEVFGALSVSALGWAACQCSGTPWRPSAPLWFAGYLLVYNLDRLYPDPADSLNTPLRFRYRDRLRWKRLILIRLRWKRLILILLGAAILVAWPLISGQSLLLPWLLIAAAGFPFYSRPFPGAKIRLKDLPGVKSIFVPAFIATILVI